MATFVLVHGAWHGGWCWRDVRAILRAGGHEVFTPTPDRPRRALAPPVPDIDMNTHVTDIANTIVWEELDEVVLVGHSYGGNVITGVADRMKDRLRTRSILTPSCPRTGTARPRWR